MDELGLKRYCCRRMILTHVDLIDQLLQYNSELEPARSTEALFLHGGAVSMSGACNPGGVRRQLPRAESKPNVAAWSWLHPCLVPDTIPFCLGDCKLLQLFPVLLAAALSRSIRAQAGRRCRFRWWPRLSEQQPPHRHRQLSWRR